jgi:hypothetical protein
MLDKEFIIKGRFFINEINKINGELHFIPESGLELFLMGTFHGFQERFTGVSENIIYGILEEGSEITLYNCTMIKHSFNAKASYNETTFKVNIAFKGHFFNEDELHFSRFKFSLKNFDTWYGVKGIEFGQSGKDNFAIYYKRPKAIELKLKNSKIRFLNDYKSNSNNSGFSISELSNIEISDAKGFDLDEIFKHVGKFKSFIALMTYQPTFLTKLFVYNENVVHKTKYLKGEEKKIEVIWRDVNYYTTKKNLLPHEMLLTFNHLKNDVGKILKKWYHYYEEITPSFNLLFYSFRKSIIFTEEFFMDMARAIEVWHRRTIDSQRMMPDDFQKFVLKLTSNKLLKEDEKCLLDGLLQFANEPNLKQRLDDILREYGFIFDFSDIQQERFIKSIVNSRHYYTHYDNKRKLKAKKDIDLFNLALQLRALLIGAILSKIGINKKLIKNRINDNILEHLKRPN